MSWSLISTRPVSDGDQAHDDVKAGGLARAIGTQQADNFALLHLHGDAVYDPASVIAFADFISR